MARRTFRVSRQGLTACPACGAHIKIADTDWRQTICPFCDAQLLAARPVAPRVGGRAGVLAAGLLSLGIAACDDVSEDPTGMGGMGGTGGVAGMMSDAEPDMAGDADVMAEADMEVAPEFGLQPEYGKPADDFGPGDMKVDMEVAPEFGVQPEYGKPPDDADVPPPDMGPDAEVDAEVILPPYGIPPQEDMGTDQPDEAVPAPLYGAPPQGEE